MSIDDELPLPRKVNFDSNDCHPDKAAEIEALFLQ